MWAEPEKVRSIGNNQQDTVDDNNTREKHRLGTETLRALSVAPARDLDFLPFARTEMIVRDSRS